jgi:hypothetical protein
MCGSPHDIGGHKVQHHPRSVRAHAIDMDDQFSIRLPNLGVSPIREWTKDLNTIIAFIEFEPYWETIDEMEATGIPDYRKHRFFGLDSLSLAFRNPSVWPKPDQLVARLR